MRSGGLSAPGRRFRVCILAMGLSVLALGSSVNANTLTAGERAYASHDYVRAAPLLLIAAEERLPDCADLPRLHVPDWPRRAAGYVAATSWLQLAAERGSRRLSFCSVCSLTRATASHRTGSRRRFGSISRPHRLAEISETTGRASATLLRTSLRSTSWRRRSAAPSPRVPVASGGAPLVSARY